MKKIYLSPERRPAPHGPYFGYPTLFEHDVTTSIAQKTAAALTRCGFSVKMAPPAATVRVRVAEAISWQADYSLPIHTNASSATPREGSARGVRQNTTFYEINSTPMLSVYPELAFHDNGADAQWLVENQGAIAEALCRGVCRWFGVNYTAPAGEDWQQRYLSLRQSLQALLEENPAQI